MEAGYLFNALGYVLFKMRAIPGKYGWDIVQRAGDARRCDLWAPGFAPEDKSKDFALNC